MADTPSTQPRSAGVFLALAMVAGAVIGTFAGEPSLGFLIGLGTGIAVTLALWLIDRRRT
ncbi:hypothetical protein IC614_06365 [Allosphingosinicella flava]|uniref:Uncharacterized protein n=2 Tax=Allosphingosinicella flava TaxID=2771430 RepID=A0A7T2GM12_9SPHN|nr:hypothetical protein IC614_06365 [Sphingosinicella flava]